MFFCSSDLGKTRSKFSLKKILGCCFFLYIPVTLDTASFIAGVSKSTIVDWFHSSQMTIARFLDIEAQFAEQNFALCKLMKRKSHVARNFARLVGYMEIQLRTKTEMKITYTNSQKYLEILTLKMMLSHSVKKIINENGFLFSQTDQKRFVSCVYRA